MRNSPCSSVITADVCAVVRVMAIVRQLGAETRAALNDAPTHIFLMKPGSDDMHWRHRGVGNERESLTNLDDSWMIVAFIDGRRAIQRDSCETYPRVFFPPNPSLERQRREVAAFGTCYHVHPGRPESHRPKGHRPAQDPRIVPPPLWGLVFLSATDCRSTRAPPNPPGST